MKKKLTLVVSLLLVMALSIGGTIAYLTDTSEVITNTFTVGNVKINLAETNVDEGSELANSYKMIPGNTIKKDPTVTVEAGSEDCWLFVKIEESTSLDTYITYTVDSDWTELEDGVYYIKQDAVADNVAEENLPSYSVLTDDQVTVNTKVTQADMDALKAQGATQPTLTFTAYAIQQANIGTDKTTDAEKAAAAWAELNPSTED